MKKGVLQKILPSGSHAHRKKVLPPLFSFGFLPSHTFFVQKHQIPAFSSKFSFFESRRFVRTSFLREDEDFIDPMDPALADSVDEWKFSDDGSRKMPILERSNVGMGTLILNCESMPLKGANLLYRKLRDLEVNTLRRFVLLTSVDRSIFQRGRELTELLLLAEYSQRIGSPHEAAKAYLKNFYELSWLIRTYYKPLISFMNGAAEDSGMSVSCLANCSGAYHNSQATSNECAWGWFPDGGMSFVLSRLRGSLGVYLALTGNTLRGADLIWSGLCKFWISPEAFQYMEITSEKQLEVSEHDGKALLYEHFLEPPTVYSLSQWERLINLHFNKKSLSEVEHQLSTTASLGQSALKHERYFDSHFSSSSSSSSLLTLEVANWASETLEAIRKKSPLSLMVTFELLKKVKDYRQALIRSAVSTPEEYNERLIVMEKRLPHTPLEASRKELLDAIDERTLSYALGIEFTLAKKMLMSPDLIEGIGKYLLNRMESSSSSSSQPFKPNWQSVGKSLGFSASSSASGGGVSKLRKELLEVLNSPEDFEFKVRERSEFPLSAEPQIRRLHPDFDSQTELDHDPTFMQEEVNRWSNSYLDDEFSKLRKALS